MNILYIAYSCNPFAGSEDKIGWCVPYESSKTNKVYVITKEEQREPVEKYLQSHPLENIKFYYVDIPNSYKKIFKGFMYSGRLNVWNRRVLPLAKKICADQQIDVIHQIKMVGVCIKYMHENYGGILQAYATVSYLENQNIEYELVRYTRTVIIFVLLPTLTCVMLNDAFEAWFYQTFHITLYEATLSRSSRIEAVMNSGQIKYGFALKNGILFAPM